MDWEELNDREQHLRDIGGKDDYFDRTYDETPEGSKAWKQTKQKKKASEKSKKQKDSATQVASNGASKNLSSMLKASAMLDHQINDKPGKQVDGSVLQKNKKWVFKCPCHKSNEHSYNDAVCQESMRRSKENAKNAFTRVNQCHVVNSDKNDKDGRLPVEIKDQRFHIAREHETWGYVFGNKWYDEPIFPVKYPGVFDNVKDSGSGWCYVGDKGKDCIHCGSAWKEYIIPAYYNGLGGKSEYKEFLLEELVTAVFKTVRLSVLSTAHMTTITGLLNRTITNLPVDIIEFHRNYFYELALRNELSQLRQSQGIFSLDLKNPYEVLAEYENDALVSTQFDGPFNIFSTECDTKFVWEKDKDIKVTGDVAIEFDEQGNEHPGFSLQVHTEPKKMKRTGMFSLEGERKFKEFSNSTNNANKALKRLLAKNDNDAERKFHESKMACMLAEAAKKQGLHNVEILAKAVGGMENIRASTISRNKWAKDPVWEEGLDYENLVMPELVDDSLDDDDESFYSVDDVFNPVTVANGCAGLTENFTPNKEPEINEIEFIEFDDDDDDSVNSEAMRIPFFKPFVRNKIKPEVVLFYNENKHEDYVERLQDIADEKAMQLASEKMMHLMNQRYDRQWIDLVLDVVPELKEWTYLSVYELFLEYVEPLYSRFANGELPHVKKKLRQMYVKLAGSEATDIIMVQRLEARIKRELAKANKAPRLYVGYEAGCMYANELPEFVKVALSQKIELSHNGQFFTIYCFTKPRMKEIDEVFNKIAKGLTNNEHIICIYSDDSVWSGCYKYRTYAFNCDIAACDASVRASGFFLSGMALAGFDVERAVGLIEQCKLPITLRDPEDRSRKIKIQRVINGKVSPIEGSGTVLTTINNFHIMLLSAFVYIYRGFYGEDKYIRRAGLLTGLNLEVSEDYAGTPEKLQFLKYSPIMCTDGNYHMTRNGSTVCRGLGKIDEDMEAKHLGMTIDEFRLTPWSQRMELYCSMVVAGLIHEVSDPIILAFRSRFTAPTEVKVESFKHIETEANEFVALEESYARRYDLTTGEIADLASLIKGIQLGEIVVDHVLTRMYEVDYGL